MSEPRSVRLLVNADDFGWSKSVNAGIVEAHLEGIVTSTSLLAAGRDFDDAVRLASSAPQLSVGVHLNIYRGVPVLPPERIPTLVGTDGRFPGDWRETVRGLATGRIDLAEVEAEFTAAVEKVRTSGIEPTHLDSEKHLHHWPSVFRVVSRVASRFGIERVRVVREPLGAHPIPNGLTLLGVRDRAIARAAGLTVAEATVGVTEAPVDLAALERLLRAARAPSVELVCHPGRIDDEFREIQETVSNRLVESREQELATLTDARAVELVSRIGCELCSTF